MKMLFRIMDRTQSIQNWSRLNLNQPLLSSVDSCIYWGFVLTSTVLFASTFLGAFLFHQVKDDTNWHTLISKLYRNQNISNTRAALLLYRSYRYLEPLPSLGVFFTIFH